MSETAPLHPLRAWREKAGFTQGHCAKKVGSTRQAWADWERGARVPNKSFMPKVLKLTDGKVTADALYQQLDGCALQEAG